MEEWCQIVRRGFILHYEVSSEGRVRNTKTGRIKKQSTNSKGYLFVSLSFQYERPFQVQTHILVAAAFLGLTEKARIDVHHKDENKKNNCKDNLECRHRSKHRSGHMLEIQSDRRVDSLATQVVQQIEFDEMVRRIAQ